MAADKTTVSRPYAKAAFEEARARGQLAEWSQALAAAAGVVRDPRVEQLLGNPEVAHAISRSSSSRPRVSGSAMADGTSS